LHGLASGKGEVIEKKLLLDASRRPDWQDAHATIRALKTVPESSGAWALELS
jgi:hypothetical protein